MGSHISLEDAPVVVERLYPSLKSTSDNKLAPLNNAYPDQTPVRTVTPIPTPRRISYPSDQPSPSSTVPITNTDVSEPEQSSTDGAAPSIEEKDERKEVIKPLDKEWCPRHASYVWRDNSCYISNAVHMFWAMNAPHETRQGGYQTLLHEVYENASEETKQQAAWAAIPLVEGDVLLGDRKQTHEPSINHAWQLLSGSSIRKEEAKQQQDLGEAVRGIISALLESTKQRSDYDPIWWNTAVNGYDFTHRHCTNPACSNYRMNLTEAKICNDDMLFHIAPDEIPRKGDMGCIPIRPISVEMRCGGETDDGSHTDNVDAIRWRWEFSSSKFMIYTYKRAAPVSSSDYGGYGVDQTPWDFPYEFIRKTWFVRPFSTDKDDINKFAAEERQKRESLFHTVLTQMSIARELDQETETFDLFKHVVGTLDGENKPSIIGYRLRYIALYSGNGMYGHYISVVRYAPKKWIFYNDLGFGKGGGEPRFVEINGDFSAVKEFAQSQGYPVEKSASVVMYECVSEE
ncbi:MAG TPA: hypothetical protein VEF04_03340 [Blastocatellia bacterium]|nr:hypothetical protein [Blastocatellia bacterium]